MDVRAAPSTPTYYLVASFRPFAPATPLAPHGYGPVPAAIKVANVLCIIEAANHEAAVKLLADWDKQPVGTRYFAVEIPTFLAT